jgi:hypothetical protein
MPAEDRPIIAPGSALPALGDRPRVSRRSVLRGAAGAGVASLAAGALAAPAMASAAAARLPGARHERHGEDRARPGPAGAAAGEDVVVHVRDVRTGELDVFSGTSHIRLSDPDLAARLARAIRPAQKLAR